MKRALLPALALLLPLTACGGDDESTASDDGSGITTLTVYAAASLTATFEQIAEDFEAEHDGVEVELSFGGSSDLVTQITEGAEADVFASAATKNMDDLVAADLTGAEPQDFATNVLEIAVPPGNPAGVKSLQDLTGDLNLVLCAPEVPCGAAAQKVAEAAGVTFSPVSEEQAVTDVLAKVASGEADAGLVYVTDVAAAGDDVEGIEFPESADVVNTYPIAPVADSDEADLAQEFVDFVLGATGQSVLQDAGFGQP
ncbi:molybdate ABC transporter substrate-binding protein [Nocardioides lianchengensis]|uniref:Molybdate transport system substrate-binding protein n=1 Tax=Nocardioides lianchengensis TaxID=1045774 RepID=A0A1G6V5Z4_9ACTN|nr:molybdate ABC transporter substrate-binding protein [Nocardioides lianchengensis]NYG11134.1 molybdate transport system substrate-binding protein [Nocardioides lianchengensis]SDD48447.1 molybdate transport system substrate-binding protein [Nocardioides lianchengensis]